MINLDLTGRKAIVTGASLGIGAATVRLLADHGASVAFCARGQDGVDELASYSDTIRGYVADMSDAESTNQFLQRATNDLGDADILVNNVGASPSRNFLYMDDADWEQLFQLNMMSAVRCTRHVLPPHAGSTLGSGRDDLDRRRPLSQRCSHRLRSNQVRDDLHRQGVG